MANASTASLVNELRQYRLLEPAQLAQVNSSLQLRFPEPKALVRELIQRGWLTAYQGNQLLQGKGQELVLGQYVLLERLGEGGMGQVFKARHRHMRRMVALKLMHKEGLAKPEALKRFQREVRAAAALSHPNIVLAYDADEIGGTPVLVMECLEGATDLSRLVKQNGPLPVAQACDYIRQAALGLQHAAEQGLVHRDIKPHNLLLSANGTVVKVLDLGMARLDQSSADGDPSTIMTQVGMVIGTADYMAPEQALTPHTADSRADIYSLGCTLYFLLTSQVPFPGGSVTEKLLKHQLDQPQPLEQLRPDIPSGLAAVVRQMMAKKPQERYQKPAEVAAALSLVVSTDGGTSPVAGRSSQTKVEGCTTGADFEADTLHSVWAYLAQGGEAAEGAASVPSLHRKAGDRRLLWYGATGGFFVLLSVLLVVLLLHEPASTTPKRTSLGTPEAGKMPPEVFQDFEAGSYGNWKRTGTAFGDKPATGALPGQQPVTGFGGKYLVNSFCNGDSSTGTLASPEFVLKRPFIHFRIGGGNQPGKTGINLLVGSKVVRTATGKDSEKMVWAFWDVREFKGQKAVIEIVDHATGPWGHISIDDVGFADEPPPAEGLLKSPKK